MAFIHSSNQTTTTMKASRMFNFDYEPNYLEDLPSLSPISSWTDLIYRLVWDHDNFNSVNSIRFFYKNYPVCLYFVTVYLVLVFLGKKWMTKREPFDLRTALAIWSGALSIFSIIGSVIVWTEFIEVFMTRGFVATYANNVYHRNPLAVTWYTLFILSKVLELFDTAFIVLRKQKLLPLHWIHHCLTLLFCFFVYSDGTGTARWMVCMNFLIHSVMYGYYSLRALRVPIHRSISVFITTSQIVQMFFGLYIHGHVLIMLASGDRHCHNTYRTAVPGFAMYLLYFYFFIQFFIDSYITNKRHSPKKKTDNDCNNNAANNNNITPSISMHSKKSN